MRRRRGSAIAEALALVADAGDDCIAWTGSLQKQGYGSLRGKLAHRVIYERVVGPIPDGLTLDHTCHTAECPSPGLQCPHRRCINPRHLEPLTPIENTLRGFGPTAVNARKAACNKGHEFTPANTYITTVGGRRCRTCGAAASRAYKARRAEVSPC